MKITVLAHLDKEDGEITDVVAGQVAAALRKGGHRVSVFGVHGDPRKLIAGLIRRSPELVFNLMDVFGDPQLGSVPVVGALDLLGLPYTGAGPGEYYLQDDKSLGRKLLAYDGIDLAPFAVATPTELPAVGKLRLPLCVKPLHTDLLLGSRAVVHSTGELVERVAEIHRRSRDAALVEEYVAGREFFVGVLGNHDPLAFQPMELEFAGAHEKVPRFPDDRHRGHERAIESRAPHAVLADVTDERRVHLQKTALAAYRTLRIRDYGRIDLRLTDHGEILVTEVRAGGYLEQASAYALAAAAAGVDYEALINRIAEVAKARHDQRGAPLRHSAAPPSR